LAGSSRPALAVRRSSAPLSSSILISAGSIAQDCSSAVVPSGLFHRQRLGLALDVRLGDFADDDAMIAEFVAADDVAFDRRGRVADDWRAVGAALEREVTEFAVLGFDVTKERAGDRFLPGSEHRERKLFRVLDRRVRARVLLDPDDYQRRVEAGLRDPVDGCRGGLAAVG